MDGFLKMMPMISMLVSLGTAIYVFIIGKKEKSYADIDSAYFQILKIGMENPDFRIPEKTGNYKEEFKENSLIKYELYAYMVWNICETIYDREGGKVSETWKPVIKTENDLHRAWFDAKENTVKFKQTFRDYITKTF